jgi:transcriptional repressor NrdR
VCDHCGQRWTTYERLERPNLTVIKTSGNRQLFDREKLERAIVVSVGKFLGGEMEIEEVVNAVEKRLFALGTDEVESRQIGELVLEELGKKDDLAFVRFASVFREFKDLDEFVAVIDELKAQKEPKKT